MSELGSFSLLDVTATRDANGRELGVAVVNRSPDAAQTTRIELTGRRFAGEVTVDEVNGDDPTVRNAFDRPDAVGVRTSRTAVVDGGFEYSFAPHSVTLLRGQIA